MTASHNLTVKRDDYQQTIRVASNYVASDVFINYENAVLEDTLGSKSIGSTFSCKICKIHVDVFM